MDDFHFKRESRGDPPSGQRRMFVPWAITQNPIDGFLAAQLSTAGEYVASYPVNGATATVRTPSDTLFILEETPGKSEADGIYDRRANFGVDERVEVDQFSPHGLEAVIRAFFNRSVELSSNADKGNSLRHFHPYIVFDTQKSTLMGRLLAIRDIPPLVQAQIQILKDWYKQKERCLYCDILSQEMENFQNTESRVISSNSHYLSFVPFAPSTEFNVNIIPIQHIPRFISHANYENSDKRTIISLRDDYIQNLAIELYNIISRIQKLSPQYSIDKINIIIHSGPLYSKKELLTDESLNALGELYHLHIDVSPQTKNSYQIPGFGSDVVAGRPKDMAALLRNALNHQS